MTWQPAFQAQFTKPLIRQLMAIIQRDQRAALDYVGGIAYPAAGALASFVGYQLAPQAIQQFPVVLIAPMQSTFAPAAEGSLHSETRVYCSIAVQDQTAAVLAEMVQDYVRAVDAIFNTLYQDLGQLYQGWLLTLPFLGGSGITTTPLAEGTVKNLFVESHAYDEIRRLKQGFGCAAVVNLRIEMEET